MAALTRKFKKIFAKNAINNGVFGSKAAGSPATSTNPETIESLAAFLNGWDDATEGGLKLPTLEDMQGLKYDTDYHLAYIYQTGMQVYDSQTTYYTSDLVRKNATTEIWKSLIEYNTGNALTTGSNWSLVGNLSYIPTTSLGTAAYVNTGTSSGNVPLVGTSSATTSLAGTSLLLSAITLSNNISSPNTDIDFSSGVFQFADGSGRAAVSALTKKLNANWVAGTNQGGLDTGTKTTSTWYHCYAIYNPTTQVSDFLFSTGATTPIVLPSGFTKYKWIGAILNTSGNVILSFIQDGKTITYNSILIYDSPSIPTTPTVASCFTPAGIRVKGLFTALFDTTNTVTTTLIYTDPIKTTFTRIVAYGGPYNSGNNFEAFTDYSTYIKLSKSDANAIDYCKVYNYGWEIPDNLY
jgi:hypothetical protein